VYVYKHTHNGIPALEKKEILTFIQLLCPGGHVLSERSQTQKSKYNVMPPGQGSKIDSQMQRTEWWLPRAGREGK
jgi:hypothetical protein